MNVDACVFEKTNTAVVAINFVVVHVLNAAFLDKERAVNTGAVGDVDTRAVARIAVVGQLGDGIKFGVLHFGAGHETPVHFHLAAVVIARRHAVPTETDDRVVFDNDAPHLEPLRITAFSGDVRDLHVHGIVFINIHTVSAPERPPCEARRAQYN